MEEGLLSVILPHRQKIMPADRRIESQKPSSPGGAGISLIGCPLIALTLALSLEHVPKKLTDFFD
ncbi:hypothetical protein CU048_04960 [Beijerinckiaceae bacterium]|nr:hypothetical protein CU048_04960 [Beijerinckiaceae bacterium]